MREIRGRKENKKQNKNRMLMIMACVSIVTMIILVVIPQNTKGDAEIIDQENTASIGYMGVNTTWQKVEYAQTIVQKNTGILSRIRMSIRPTNNNSIVIRTSPDGSEMGAAAPVDVYSHADFSSQKIVLFAGNTYCIVGIVHPDETGYGLGICGTSADYPSGSLSIRIDSGSWATQSASTAHFTEYIIIDTTPPTTTCSCSGTAGVDDWYSSNVTATVTGTDTGTGIQKTCCSVNGAGWVEYISGTYSNTFTTEGHHNISYYSIDVSNNTESISTTRIKIDKTLPISNNIIINSNATYTNTMNVQLSVSANDMLSGLWLMQFSDDGIGWSSWQNYSETTTYTIPSGDETKTVYFRVKDQAGNIANSIYDTIILDQTKPTTTHSLLPSAPNGNNGWYTTDVTVSLSTNTDTSGVNITKYKIGSGDWQTGTSFTLTNDAAYTVYYYSIDNAGNIETTNSITVKIDKTVPTTSHSISGVLGSDGWYVSDVNITLTSSDVISGIANTYYQINNGAAQTGTSITLTQEGSHTINYWSADNAGNQEQESNITIKIDKTAPTTSHSLSGTVGNNNWYISDVVVTLSYSDTVSGIYSVKYRVDNGVWQDYTPSFTISSEGTHTIEYYATDNASNIETTKSSSFKIDKTAPSTAHSLSGTSGSNGWYISDVTVSLSPSDATSGAANTYYQINSGATQTGTSILLTSSGTYTIKYWSADNAGNSEQDSSVTVKIDKGKPTVSLGSPSADATLDTNTPTLSWTGSDDASGISYYEVLVDNNNNFASPEFTKTTASTSATTTSLPDNTYYWRVRAVDNAGNVGDWQERTFTISTGPPTDLSIKINNDAQLTNSTQVILTLSASRNAYEMCFSNDNLGWSSWEAFASTKAWTLQNSADGTKTVYFKCRNLYGNESEAASDTIILDTTPPSLQISEPQSGTLTNKDNITVKGEVRDLNGIETAEIYVNDTIYSITLVDGNFSQIVNLSNGSNIIKMRAKDYAGNRAEISITVTYDPTMPTLIIYSPANNSLTNNPQRLVSGKTEPDYAVKINGALTAVNETGCFTRTITLTEGSNLINVTASNAAGTATTIFIYVTLDTAPPSSPKNLTISPASWTNVNSFTIDWVNPSDTSGIAGIWYKFGTAPSSTYNGTYSTQKPLVISAPAAGTTQIFLWLQDKAGNINHTLYSVCYAKYDPNPPTTLLLIFGQAGANNWYLDNVQVELSAADDLSLVKEVWYSYEGSEWQRYTGKFNVTIPGQHKIEFYAVDNAGNVETVQTKHIKIDKDAPYTDLTATGPVGSPDWYVASVTVTIEGHDDTSGLLATLCRIGEEGEFQNYTSSFTLTEEGLFKVYYYSVDLAGKKEQTRCRVIGIDKTPPASTLDIQCTLGTNGWYTSTAEVKIRAGDTVSGILEIHYRFNSDNWTKANIITTSGGAYAVLTLADGIHNLSYYSINSADLVEAQKNVQLKIDAQAPTKPVIALIPEFINTSTIKITWTESLDSMSGFAGYILLWSQNINFSVYSQTNLLQSANYTLTLSEGSRCYIKVKAFDQAGNEIYSEAVNTFSDTIPPETYAALVGQLYLGAYVTPVTVELYTTPDSSGVKEIKYSIGEEWLRYTGQFTLTENKTYVLKYYSVDRAGNIENVKTVNFKIDIPLANPVVSVVEPNNNVVEGNTTISWSMSSPVADTMYVTIIVLQSSSGYEQMIAENLENITRYTINTNLLPNAEYYIKIIVKDQHNRIVNSSTLTTIIVKNRYIQQTQIQNTPLNGDNTTITIDHDGSKASITTQLINRQFNSTTYSIHFYIDDEIAGTKEITLNSMGNDTATITKTLITGQHTLHIKIYSNGMLVEENTQSFNVEAAHGKTATTQPMNPVIILLIGAPFFGVMLFVALRIKKRNLRKTNQGDEEGEELPEENETENEEKTEENEKEEGEGKKL